MHKLHDVRHSLAHLLAAAVLKKYPKAKLGIGPVIDDGFYYDFGVKENFAPEDLAEFEASMREMIKAKLPFKKVALKPAELKKFFTGQPFKKELYEELKRGEILRPSGTSFRKGGIKTSENEITFYKTGEVFVDLCRGGHVEKTSEIDPESFKLDKIAGAYWKGNEKNPQLQRIYGLAFNNEKELKEYLARREESMKRDHRKLGKDLNLFALVDEIGPGLPLFYPKGAILRREVENYIIELQERRGYEPIWIPHITKGELYKISGHLDKYDAMYPPMKLKDEADYYLKPMNCPHFMMLYRTTPHSYRELPLRWTATTTNYRYEKSGELSGLTRVRSLTQDDCHVFARPDQIAGEINLMLDMIAEVYKTFGFNDFWVRISTHDPKNKERYIGDPKIWKESEEILESLIKSRGWRHEMGVGEAAFYGPKLDFIFKDVLGREWQLSTIQLDMNLPEKFELEYIDESGKPSRPVVIHRAILGSTERFLGILIEHFGGAFPLWLSPIQAAVLPIGEAHREYASKISSDLAANGIRIKTLSSDETLGKRIREAEMQKIPYILVIGGKEVETQTVSVRDRKKGDLGAMKAEVLLEKLREEIDKK
jgi:threonyl-tRNA synthetase